MTTEPLSIVPAITDAQKAATYRAELLPILEKAADVVQRARSEGLTIGFSLAQDEFGRMRVGLINVTKPL